MLKVITTWRNDNPNTVWNRLAARLGREPTNQEAKEEVLRILKLTKEKIDARKK